MFYNIPVVVQGEIVKGPKDDLVIAGNTVQFDCEAGFEDLRILSWYFNEIEIFHSYQGYEEYPVGKSKYHVTVSGKQFKLTIKDVLLEDGGIYTCSAVSDIKSAKLLVYGESNKLY